MKETFPVTIRIKKLIMSKSEFELIFQYTGKTFLQFIKNVFCINILQISEVAR